MPGRLAFHEMKLLRLGFSILLAGMAVSCSSLRPSAPKPLLVGTTANCPLMIWQQDGRFSGAEYDLLQKLAARLNRPLQVVVLGEDESVGALMTGEVDILVGALTIERATRLRIGFTAAFLQSGQMAVCRRENRSEFASMKRLKKGGIAAGVRKGSGAERILPQLFPRCEVVVFLDTDTAVSDLLGKGRIALYVDDAPIVWSLVAKRESLLAVLPFALSSDLYVWGVRPDDNVLRGDIDEALRVWRADGTLTAVLGKWLPLVAGSR